MDTENCTALYLQVCQTFLTCKFSEPSTFEELFKLLPWLRQSLTCCVCAKVLHDPMSSAQSNCQHFICSKCKGGKMILRPSCSWCKDQEPFTANKQLHVLVDCFKKICELIDASPIKEHIVKFDAEVQRAAEMAKTTNLAQPTEKFPRKRPRYKRRVPAANSVMNISVGQVLEDGKAIDQNVNRDS